jgi:hypothetical protein
MAGRLSFARLRARLSPASRARAERKARALHAEMDMADLRRAMRLSQVELARQLRVGQAAVAKLEKRTDMYVSTLRRFIEAMGGELHVVAKFPSHDVRIGNFRDVSEKRRPVRAA